MRSIFDDCLKDGYKYEIIRACISDECNELHVDIKLNFIIPLAYVKREAAQIMKKVNGLDDVKFNFIYENMVQTKDQILKDLIPHLIDIINGKYKHITRTIKLDEILVENNKIKLFAVGEKVVKELNDDVAGKFNQLLYNMLKVNYIVEFVNDKEIYKQVVKKKENEEILDTQRKTVSTGSNTSEPVKKSFPTKNNNSNKGKYNSNYKRTKKNEGPVEMVGNRLLGKAITTEAMDMEDFDETSKFCCVEGTLFDITKKDLGTGSKLVTMLVTNGKTSMCMKTFLSGEQWNMFEENLKVGDGVKARGNAEWDTFSNTPSLKIKDLEKVKIEGRKDNCVDKRVELHAHSKMSMMDGLQNIKDLVETAASWGHKAVAITDHGVCQSFPEAAKVGAKKGIKILYGVEGYLLDDDGLIDDEGNINYKGRNTNHIIIFAKTQEGLKNLYKLVSISHINYFYKKPRIPKSVLAANREGLILGSACEAGEVFRGITSGRSDEELDKLVEFYDYLEIQPLVNNMFMIDKGIASSRDDLIKFNKKVIELGEKNNKKVVATCDAHYTNSEDAIYRNILMSGMGYKNLGEGGLYLRTTEEMLNEFDYLDEKTRQEIVIDNPNVIADELEDILPVPKGKFPPHIKDCEKTLRDSCMKKAYEIYGNPLPEPISIRLEKELSAIIDEGYAVMYVSAQMLVEKSLSDGYLVGSRGSVGSSFAATMAGITEVNPLPPHYICPKCKNLEWGDETVYECGVDMPERECPKCGTKYKQEGFTIPFETFLGIPGKQKEPDIDLNFAGEYQPIAHKYVDEIFGKENVFKAGTIGTIAGKTAYGYVMKYFEEREQPINKYEVERLKCHCEGVKRTTGQHPGGIIILPRGHEIYEFCPVQRPANDMNSDIVTTHFDYHAIDENLLKLDILGHDVPSMIRHLQDMTGIDPLTVPLKDEKVNSIFTSIEALDIKDPNYQYVHGSYGIPEFGTKFVRQMLDDTKPKIFADLIRISGFSHGTNVWLGNAQEYIRSNTATMKNAISTRDDIMNYLMLKGVPGIPAFTIMEKVRKGKGVTDEEAELMTSHTVPNWYIDSCRKISYMFPRAHAVAYVTMAYRIAYFKVYYPPEFYAVYLTTKIADFNWDVIKKGSKAILSRIESITLKGKNAKKKEEDEVTVLEICYEMYARGYEFDEPSLGGSKAIQFTVENGKVKIPFCALPGVGENAGKSIVEAYNKKPFETVEEIRLRAKANKTAVESLREAGVLDGLLETDQFTFL